jgi:hypothetical protein
MADSGGTSWLRYGCFGCLGILLIAVLVVVTVTGLAALKAREEKITERQLSPEISVPETPRSEAVEIQTRGQGRVVLNLWHAEFEIHPADAGESLHVEATYDENSYELLEQFDAGDESGWVYEVTFRRTGSWLMTGLKQFFSKSSPKVVIFLPPDVKIDLEIDAQQGSLVSDLGGLWIGSAELGLKQGALQLTFDEPLREPMERLAIDFSMGGGEMGSIGNASPANLDLDISMGGAEIDLRGPWSQDAAIRLKTRMSGALVRLPRDVLIEGIEGKGLTVEEPTEIRPPKLVFEIDADDRGDLEFID